MRERERERHTLSLSLSHSLSYHLRDSSLSLIYLSFIHLLCPLVGKHHLSSLSFIIHRIYSFRG